MNSIRPGSPPLAGKRSIAGRSLPLHRRYGKCPLLALKQARRLFRGLSHLCLLFPAQSKADRQVDPKTCWESKQNAIMAVWDLGRVLRFQSMLDIYILPPRVPGF